MIAVIVMAAHFAHAGSASQPYQPFGSIANVTVSVDVTPARAVNRLVPLRAMGAGVDAENSGAVPYIYGRTDVAAMLSAGLGPVSYRLYTELGVQAWHWNPSGSWSDASANQGYWTGSPQPSSTIVNSFGYRLPERGFTHDQANDDDYSRLDDGNTATYWKSNPYLTHAFTGETDGAHPQWVFVDLGSHRPVNAARIVWAAPYATAYRVQRWNGPDPLYSPANGRWVDFPSGVVSNGAGGTVTLTLANSPVSARYVRVLMTASSNTCDSHGASDARNCLGYAIAELGVGRLNPSFSDYVRHVPNQSQTPTYAASVDPWHTPVNRVTDEVQPGLDAVFDSGVTRGLPALVPVSLLYGTPEDAVAEIRYLKARGDAISGIELGEEPDGQFMVPEDYAALYIQWAARLHALDPNLKLGGPVFQGSDSDIQTWRNAAGDPSWLRRFVLYLKAHGGMGGWQFMSFEHYPFGMCDRSPYADLQLEPRLAGGILDIWRNDGVPPNVPFLITETNFSANAGAVFQDVPGALWVADMIGAFFSNGASGVYLYQYAPEPMMRTVNSCVTYGSYGMFVGTNHYAVRQKTAEFFAASMLSTQFAQPVDALHLMFRAVALSRGLAQKVVTAYALRRPDGTYALMLINKDPQRAITATLDFSAGGKRYRFGGILTQSTFGRAQYVWHGDGPHAYANPDGPIDVRDVAASSTFTLEPGSITVLRGKLVR